jgi:hypothetical protein
MIPKNGNGQLIGNEESEWIQLDHTHIPFNVSVVVGAPPSLSGGTITLLFTLSNDHENTQSHQIKAHTSMDTLTLDAGKAHYVSFAFPCTAIKFKAENVAGGPVTFDVVQAGPEL